MAAPGDRRVERISHRFARRTALALDRQCHQTLVDCAGLDPPHRATVAFASTDYAASLYSEVGRRGENQGAGLTENSLTGRANDAAVDPATDLQAPGGNRLQRGESGAVLNPLELLKNALTISLIVTIVGFVTWLWSRMKPKRRALVR